MNLKPSPHAGGVRYAATNLPDRKRPPRAIGLYALRYVGRAALNAVAVGHIRQYAKRYGAPEAVAILDAESGDLRELGRRFRQLLADPNVSVILVRSSDSRSLLGLDYVSASLRASERALLLVQVDHAQDVSAKRMRDEVRRYLERDCGSEAARTAAQAIEIIANVLCAVAHPARARR